MQVTVLMTLYNKGPYVVEAARSVLEGTFKDLELLVVDDASTDNGPELVACLGDTRVRLVRNAVNSGRAAAANRGYAEARGTYIAVLDADDRQHPERLSRQVAYMEAHPEVVISGTGVRYFGGRSGTHTWPSDNATCRAHLLFTDPVLYGTSIMRRSTLVQQGLRSIDQWTLPGEDYLFTMQWAPHGRYGNLPDILVDYRIGEQNQRHGRDPVSDRAALCREVFRLLNIPLNDEELDVHLLLHQLTRVRPTAEVVERLIQWEHTLKERVVDTGWIPVELFNAELARRMDKAFFTIADHDTVGAWAFLKTRGPRSIARLRYLAAALIRSRRTMNR
jgi:glycosyltransferase involved in cell wall biosynthesis